MASPAFHFPDFATSPQQQLAELKVSGRRGGEPDGRAHRILSGRRSGLEGKKANAIRQGRASLLPITGKSSAPSLHSSGRQGTCLASLFLVTVLQVWEQRIEQRLRFLQIARLKPLRKPPVNRSQQFARFAHLALVTPEAG
jgi:hypothetical protein